MLRTLRLLNLSWLLVLSSCSPAPEKLLYCHTWTAQENASIRGAIVALNDDSPLVPVLEDYKRICANL